MDEKIKTAEMLLKAGVITQEEFEQLKKSREELGKKLEESQNLSEEKEAKNIHKTETRRTENKKREFYRNAIFAMNG